MVKEMKRREVERVLASNKCPFIRSTGRHDVYGCPCGQHRFALPRHNKTTPGVIRDAIAQLKCLPEGWLQ